MSAAQAAGGALQVGEELQYKVKYGFIRIGTLTVRTFRDPASAEPQALHVAMQLRSADGLPFVHIREYSESILSAVDNFSRCLYAKDESSDPPTVTRVAYDEGRRVITYRMENMRSGATLRADTLRGAAPHLDGPTMLAFTREHAQCNCLERVPTLVGGNMAATVLDFRHAPEMIDIGAWDDAIRVRRYDGRAEWSTATEGMSGAFTGWISDDNAAVPIRSEMKIAVGSIAIDLEKWNRPGWTPPGTESGNTAQR